jgi:glycosyltransferase involved in cell wall biosynthesis
VGGLRTKGWIKETGENIPLVTVVTVVFNGESALEQTILSVIGQTYDNIEYIVIDGGSTDRSMDVIKRYGDAIDLWISGPDQGIYDAMNRGIALAAGQWLNFMNANDVFCKTDTVRHVVEQYMRSRTDNKQFLYSDVLLSQLTSSGETRLRTYKCDHAKRLINHQASFYLKSLHDIHGPYLVAKGITISDYLFFSLIDPARFLKVDQPIAQYDVTGISQSRSALEQKFIVDYLVNGMSRTSFLFFFLAYFHIRGIKSFMNLCRDFWRRARSFGSAALARYLGSPQK